MLICPKGGKGMPLSSLVNRAPFAKVLHGFNEKTKICKKRLILQYECIHRRGLPGQFAIQMIGGGSRDRS